MTAADNLIFIGMPGSGKSTLGKKIANLRDIEFIDTDELIELRYGCSFQQIIDRHGIDFIKQAEEQTIIELDVEGSLISTGGSVIYSESAMRHLQAMGRIIYLHISMLTLNKRVDNKADRGLVKLPYHSLPKLYQERLPLYEKWADVTVDNNRPLSALQVDQLCQQIIK